MIFRFYAISPDGFVWAGAVSIISNPPPDATRFSASSISVSPVISAKYNDMSSRLRPFVSGIKKNTNTHTKAQTTASNTKKGPQPMALEVDKKVDAMTVATIRLQKVAMDMDLARMLVGKTSDGMSQATGPIPTLKKERYSASPVMAKTELFCPTKEKLIKRQAPPIPVVFKNNFGEIPGNYDPQKGIALIF